MPKRKKTPKRKKIPKNKNSLVDAYDTSGN
jgi:hypothetical protein